MGLSHSPKIVTNGLVLCLDAANPKSYPGSGTAWTDLSGNARNATKGGSTATITTKTYSDLLFTNQIGTDFVHQATGLKINTNYGIIANPISYNQNISVQQVLIS